MKTIFLFLTLLCAIPTFGQSKEALQRTVGTNTVTGSLSSTPAQVATIAALKAVSIANVPNGTQVDVTGYYSAGDGGGGVFFYNSASVAASNNGTIIAPNTGSGRWIRYVSDNYTNVRWFGAKGDGVSNDTTAVTAAYNAINTGAPGGGWLYFPSGTFLFNLTMIGNGNASVCGNEGTTVLKHWSPGYLFTLSGFAQVLDRTYFKGFRIQGSGVGYNGISLTTTHIAMENVWMDNVEIGIYALKCIGHHITNSRIYAVNYGIVMIGAVAPNASYSGFNVFDDIRISAAKAAIYADNTYSGGGGGNVYRKIWCESMAGVVFYGNSASAAYAPDFFQYIWTEGVATATTINFADVGGPASVTINKNAFFFDNSNAYIQWKTAPLSAANNSKVIVEQSMAASDSFPVLYTADATSFVEVREITQGPIYTPFYCTRLTPTYGVSMTARQNSIRNQLDYSLINLLGSTGDGINNFSYEPAAGVTVALADDVTAPVFNRVLSVTLTTTKKAFLYSYTDTGHGTAYLNATAGRYYVMTGYIKLDTSSVDFGPSWTNQFPTPTDLQAGVWYQIGGIWFSGTTELGRSFYIANNSGVTVNAKISQLQLVEFTDIKAAQDFLASNRYAAGNPGGATPRYYMAGYLLRQLTGTGAPSANASFVGQEYLDTAVPRWYKATTTGTGASDWVALN